MNINKISKKRENLYEVTFDEDKINLYDDVILKYELLLKKIIDEKTFKELLKFNSYLECYYTGVKYLNAKLRTEKEIRKRLNNYSKEAVNYTVKRLQQEGFLNDDLYIKCYINDEVNLKMTGPRKIISDLKKIGLEENAINNYLNTFSTDIWVDKINKYIKKKISSNHNLSSLLLKDKITKDLYNKGYYLDVINTVISQFDFQDDPSIYEKEYLKLRNKLSKKYSGEELEYQIKMRMYQKGFKKSEVS